MGKIKFKQMLILPLALFVTEILNSIVFGIVCYLTENDEIRLITVAIFSLVMYYFIAKKIFVRINDKKTKKYSVIITSVLIMISYPFSQYLTEKTGEYFIAHLVLCSPIANFLVAPFNENLSMIFLAIFSPVSVVLIWLFSKLNNLEQDKCEAVYGTGDDSLYSKTQSE